MLNVRERDRTSSINVVCAIDPPNRLECVCARYCSPGKHDDGYYLVCSKAK